MSINDLKQVYTLNYEFHSFTKSLVIHADCFEWLSEVPGDSIHAIVTDPPLGREGIRS